MGSPAGSRKHLRDMLAFAAEHGIRPRINRVLLEYLSITLDEMNKGHMSGRIVVVME
jgi:D-arabinose 1-dehydrogenase-like Zn-dependent alcohol dehydrogenase